MINNVSTDPTGIRGAPFYESTMGSESDIQVLALKSQDIILQPEEFAQDQALSRLVEIAQSLMSAFMDTPAA